MKIFLSNDSGHEDRDRIIIFGTNETLQLLCGSQVLYSDGTFKTVPNQFLQMYTLHCLYGNSVFPCIYALTVRKNEVTYRQILTKVKKLANGNGWELQPTTVMMDFELAAMNAVREVFQGCEVTLPKPYGGRLSRMA